MKTDIKTIEETGKRYDQIIFNEDYIPKNIYAYQIRLRNEIIDKCMSNKKLNYALDLGSGTGFHLKTLSQYSENIIAVDMSIGALKESKKKHECEYIVCDINNLPFKNNSFDFIWIAGVLHHVPNDLEVVISNISHILNKDGLVLIDEPNKLNLFNYVNMKLSKADPTGNERPLSIYKIERLLRANNFTILESELYEFLSPFGILVKNDIIFNSCILLDKLMHKTFLKLIFLRWYIFASYNDMSES